MKYEKGLRYRIMILKRYGFHIRKYTLNKSVRDFYTRRCENKKTRNVELYEEIFSFIDGKNIDLDRFYYIYFEMGECLMELKRYGEACRYFEIAIDNVITESYKKNKSKFKSSHYNLFLKNYSKAIECFLKAEEFDNMDYYNNLNMYCENKYNRSSEVMGDLYASHGAKNLAKKYYDKKIYELENMPIIRHRDYDPYVDGYLKEEYDEEVKKQKAEINRIYEKIQSL